jgi:hypothetical protein
MILKSDYYSMENFSFIGSFNMGYEGFSKPLPLNRMNPIYGNKNEFLFLLGLIAMVPLVKAARKKNEDALRSIEGNATNRYEELALSHANRQPSKWTA